MLFTCIKCNENIKSHLMDLDERMCYNCLDGIIEHDSLDNKEK